ncbi:MAG: saccharopine dehydrogenase NADP-binding domain-containing protein [Bacteroidales bacterium]|nr:saccharopine dehydrogenase NADP-binding domain-containing protein [Bacteroidales bacterium]
MKGKKILILGAGLVGRAIAIDLAADHEVTSVDINEEALMELEKKYGIRTLSADLSKPGVVKKIVKDYDLVVGAVPGFMGYRMVQQVIRSGKNMVDISFFPQDPFSLDEEAKKKNVSVVVDAGVAPGMSNIFLGYYAAFMEVENYTCYVGGLPVVREWPFEYKAVFSPIDVIEEYIRPARYVENGKPVVKPALSDTELLDFQGLGTLEAWNSDGLRTLLKTMNVPDMIEKTLRYPGTVEYLKVLRESGFFSYDEIDVNGKKIRPVDVTARLLFPKWKLKPGEEDFTVMRVEISGKRDGRKEKFVYTLLDRYDREKKITSMARTTGYTCTALVNLMLNGKVEGPGIIPPETVAVKEENFTFILQYLKERNVDYVPDK